MKLHLSNIGTGYALTGYGPGHLAVNGTRYGHALVVLPDAPPRPWPAATAADIDAGLLKTLLDDRPEIVLIGTGAAQHFPAPEHLRPLIEAGIGLEIMGTPAACRTYNVLVSEGRRVIAAMCLP